MWRSLGHSMSGTSAKREAEKRREEFILPVRLDDSLLVGLPDTLCYLDLRRHPVDEVADLLIEKLGGSTAAMDRQLGEQTWVAAFGLLTQDLLDCENIPLEVSSSYAKLCDWLTEDLKSRLARTSLADPRVTEDARNGETFWPAGGLRVGAFQRTTTTRKPRVVGVTGASSVRAGLLFRTR